MTRTLSFKLFAIALLVLIQACQTGKNVSFSPEYIAAHKGQFEVYIPEVHELANILIALSDVGQVDSNMVDMTTDYYQKVKKKFSPYAKHPIVDSINKHILRPTDMNSYWYYYAVKMNACAYSFTSNNNIVHSSPVKRMGFDNVPDPIPAYVSLMEDFAKQSGFRAFYQENKPYYDSLVAIYRQLNPIDKMQHWLEGKFGFGYGNYTVYFSPLVGGAHATQKYADRHFEQTAMFVCRSEISDQFSLSINEMLDSRVVFTEIDHNFVNPISATKQKSINKALANRAKWVHDFEGSNTDAYGNPFSVFNEYMTFAVFSLYCMDHFTEQDVNVFIPRMEKQMVERRHFIKFKEFNQQLISLYKADKSVPMPELFDKMLKWCEGQ